MSIDLTQFRLEGTNVYFIGLFERGVTVLSQQTRALNLVTGLVESKIIRVARPGKKKIKDPQTVAIVGGGFAGLTAAAGLARKGFQGTITLLERRDGLLPLQQGSDTRWLHPHIYDWPAVESEINAAMLPVLNWTAARASDVAVQVLENWRLEPVSEQVSVFCNVRYLRVQPSVTQSEIEWVGERRNFDGSGDDGELGSSGNKAKFDVVILAVGFGTEKDGATSYWRNDKIGQPQLDQVRTPFVVSGQGDGAMLDLFRLRISNFRQDRILSEMFGGRRRLKAAIERIFRSFDPVAPGGLFGKFEQLRNFAPDEFDGAIDNLRKRLRRDTDAILCLNVKSLTELLETSSIRISFQNRVLVYFLFRCGGFAPSSDDPADIVSEGVVRRGDIIVRHGPDQGRLIRAVLTDEAADRLLALKGKVAQGETPLWEGGYFGQYGTLEDQISAPDEVKQSWRIEYLPSPTKLVASAFCASVAGYLASTYTGSRLRVTLHRTLNFRAEEVLQQCCHYQGVNVTDKDQGAPGRTFPTLNATIGAAFQSRRIVRSRSQASASDLQRAMGQLRLNEASRKMSKDVNLVLAIPLLQSDRNRPVAVLYIDSKGRSGGFGRSASSNRKNVAVLWRRPRIA